MKQRLGPMMEHHRGQPLHGVVLRQWENLVECGREYRRKSFSRDLTRHAIYRLARLHDVETEGGEYWYSKAKDWATASGISDGSTPEASISREQLIAILHRYAGLPAASSNSKSFADSGEVSAWANDAIDWAVSAGILNGKPGNVLEPASVVSRAEVSAMIVRFIAWRSN